MTNIFKLYIWIFFYINVHDNCNNLTITSCVVLVKQELLALLGHMSSLQVVMSIVQFLVLQIIVCVFILFPWAIVLSVLQFTTNDYPTPCSILQIIVCLFSPFSCAYYISSNYPILASPHSFRITHQGRESTQ